MLTPPGLLRSRLKESTTMVNTLPRSGFRPERVMCFLCILFLLSMTTLGSSSSCPSLINGGICPNATAEGSPIDTLPSTCSGRGTCLRGACRCDAGWAGTDCSQVLTRLKFGAVAITQEALDDGPTRYVDIVSRTFARVRDSNLELPPFNQKDCLNYILKTPLVTNWEINFELVPNSVELTIIDGGFDVAAKFSVSIPHIAVDAFVSLTPGSGTCCTGSGTSLFQETSTCTVACNSTRSDHMSVSFSMDVTARILPVLNPLTGNITVTVPPADLIVSLSPADLGFQLSCGLSSYPQLLFNLYNDYVQPWGLLLHTKLKETIQQVAEDTARAFSISVTGFRENITSTSYVELGLTTLEFVGNSHILGTVEGYVRKQRFNASHLCPLVITTYVDPSPDRDLPVPFDNLEYQETSITGSVLLQTLVEARISRSALKAAMWSALLDEPSLMTSLTGYSRAYGMLDARFIAEADWDLPVFSFPITKANNGSVAVTNTIRFAVQSGTTDLVCNNTGDTQVSAVFNKLTFDVEPIVIGNFTDARLQSPAQFRMTGQLVEWDVSRINMNLTNPYPLSIPNKLVEILASEFMATKVPVANDLLKQEAFDLPAGLVRYVPGARLEAIHDYANEGGDEENGYLVASTRCACVGTNVQFANVVVKTRMGEELMSKCAKPCITSGRRRRRILHDATQQQLSFKNEDDREDPFNGDLILVSNKQHDSVAVEETSSRRSLASELESFAQTGQCGDLPPTDFARLKLATTEVLSCAIVKDFTALATTSYAKFDCMKRLNSTAASEELGACDTQSDHFRILGLCSAPLRVVLPALYGRECIEGPAFSCSDTLHEVYASMCTCAKSDFSQVIQCEELFVPLFVSLTGFVIPLVFSIASVILVKMCGSERLNQAVFFRVKRRARDNWLINTAIIGSFIFSIAIIGWIAQDPFKAFAKTIVESDLFKVSSQIQTDFESFMVGWSMGFLFFCAFGASLFLWMSLFSLYTGRCIWLQPLPRYKSRRHNRKHVYNHKQNDGGLEWILPSEFMTGVWRQMYVFAVNSIRLIILFAIIALAIPPFFFPFRLSVRVEQPQFGNGFFENATLDVNLTSVEGAENYMNAAREIIGYTLMSSAIGFISSGLIYVFHGGAPASFAAGMVMVYLMNRKEERNRKEYEAYKHLLPPPDASELDRWRRIVYLFIWCIHATGALGSSIAAILLYQVLRASGDWAVFWLLCWVLPTPIVGMASSKRYRNHTILFTVAYISIFVVFTALMIAYSPADAAFVTWLAFLLIGAVFVLIFLILLSEFLSITDQMESSAKFRSDLNRARKMQRHGGAIAGMKDEPYLRSNKTKQQLQYEKQHLKMLAHAGKGTAALVVSNDPSLGGIASSSGNPLFLHEQMKATKGGSTTTQLQSSPLAGSDDGSADTHSEHDLMRAMAKPSPSAPIVQQQQQRERDAEAMALAAERLRRRVNRMSVALDGMNKATQQQQPPLPPGGARPTLKSALDAANKAYSESGGRAITARSPILPSPMLPPAPPPMMMIPLPSLTSAQQKERERIRKRISKRLAARGVEGDAAKELTDRIANYHLMKTAFEQQEQRNFRVSQANRVWIKHPQQQQQAAARTSPFSSAAPALASRTLSPESKTMMKKTPSALSLSPPTSPQSIQTMKKVPSEMSLSGSLKKSPPPPNASSLNRMQRSPSDGGLSPRAGPMTKTPSDPSGNALGSLSPNQRQRPLAQAQATDKTNNPMMDEWYARQFDPRNAVGGRGVIYDEDDSFFGFWKEVVAQIFRWIKERRKKNRVVNDNQTTTAGTSRMTPLQLQPLAPSDPSAPQTMKSTTTSPPNTRNRFANAKKGSSFVNAYGMNRFRSRFARVFNERIRPTISFVSDILSERKEVDDPATYGLRVPGRRMIFVQGLIFMFIILVNTGINRVSVAKLKDSAIQVALSTTALELPEAAYDWPGLVNLTEALDVPLSAYVDRATDAYILLWIVFLLWVLSLFIEILYGTFGRDMEEKRKGIKLARYIGFINLPLLLVAVVLPCGPDYVGLSTGGIKKVIPECAPKLSSLMLDVAGNLFGVVAGTYLTFQVMFVLLLILPSVSRALLFVIAREILDLTKLTLFEPRKQHHVTRKRLQNARFVWRVIPFLHPLLVYLPMLLLCQLIGKTYASVLAFLSLGIPLVTAQFQLHPLPEDQRVRDWLIYNTLWIVLYLASIVIIVLVEALDRGQVSFVLKFTFESWTWYLKSAAEVCLAIVIASDVLYLFMASEDELEADTVINDYLAALEEEAEKHQASLEGVSAGNEALHEPLLFMKPGAASRTVPQQIDV